MATTYTIISSQTLTGSQASVSFSSIPSTYTDLVVLGSARTDQAATYESIKLTINGTSTGYSWTNLYGTGSAAGSTRTASAAYTQITYGADAANATASTFSNFEIYIPSYLASQNKPIGSFNVIENNNTLATMAAVANLWQNTAAITSLTLTPDVGPNFVSGSTFYLYGIKNS